MFLYFVNPDTDELGFVRNVKTLPKIPLIAMYVRSNSVSVQ